MIPLLGFLPDADPSTPGALLAATNVVPYAQGMRGAPAPVTADGAPALAAACRNAVVATKLDGSRRVISGTATKLYELSGGSWSDVSRGGSYSLGSDDRWDYAQFGDATVATNKSTTIQRSNGSGAFADIATAPKALAIEVASNFVIAFNTDDGTYGNSPDRWWCSANGDETDWTPSATTQATTGRLVSTPGAITAAKAFGDQVVAYKDRSLYLGTFTGGAEVWRFDLIPADVGCVGVDAVTDIAGFGHVFVGRSDIMVFDGSRPFSIAEGSVRQWFYNNCSQQYLYRTIVVHDKQNNVVWIYYPGRESTGSLDSAIVYHLGRKQWGVATITVEAALNYVSAGATIDGLSGTIDTLPNVAFDSQYWLAGGRMMTVFSSAHQLSTLTGVTGASSVTLFDVGDDQAVSRLDRLRVAWLEEPAAATASGTTRQSRAGAVTGGASGVYESGKIDIRQSGRFHRLTLNMTGSWAASGVDMDIRAAGRR